MRASFSRLAFAVVLAGALLAGHEASAQTLKVAGTGGALGMMEQIGAAYAAATGVEIEIVPGLGSSGSIKAAADGAIDLAVSSRTVKPEEAAAGLTAVLFARTPVVFITSRRDPGNVNSADLAGIYQAASPQWPDGTPMHLILRTKTDTDAAIVGKLFPGLAEAMEAAHLRPEIPVTPTDQDNATLAEQLSGSFGHSGLSQIVTEKRDLRLVSIDGVEPTLANLENGTYPYGKPFYLVYSTSASASGDALLAFLRSEQGQSILREAGSLPAAE